MTPGHLLLAVGVSIYMLIAIRYESANLTDLLSATNIAGTDRASAC